MVKSKDMQDGPSHPEGGGQHSSEIEAIRAEIARQTAEEIRQEVQSDLKQIELGEVRQAIDTAIKYTERVPEQMEGEPDNKETLRGRAVDIKKTVVKILVAAKVSDKNPAQGTPTPEFAISILQQMSDLIPPEYISEDTAPYLYPILQKALSGDINDLETLAREFRKQKNLEIISPLIYKKLQKALVEVARKSESKEDAEARFEMGEVAREEEQEKMEIQTQGLAQQEKDRLKKYHDDIQKKAHEIDLEDRDKFWRDLREASETAVEEENTDQLQQVLGWSKERVEDFIKLDGRTVDLSPREYEEALRPYGITSNDLKYFSPEHVRNELGAYFNEDGLLTTQGKNRIVEGVYTSINKLLEAVSRNPEGEWQDYYNPFYEGRTERILRSKLRSLLSDKEIMKHIKTLAGKKSKDEADKAVRQFNQFVNDLDRELLEEVGIRQTYHGVRKLVINGTATPEDLAKFQQGQRASRINLILQGYHGPLMELAISEFERDLQNRLAMNGNVLPSDLFGAFFLDPTQRYQIPDYTRLRENLFERIKALRTDPNLSEKNKELLWQIQDADAWEIDRALVLAPGISLLNTLRGHEIQAMTAPRTDFQGEPVFAQYFNIRHKWKLGRGGASKFKIRELWNLKINMDEDMPFLKRIRKPWVPAKLYDQANKFARKTLAEIIEEMDKAILSQPDNEEGLTFTELLRNFSIYGFESRLGWRRGSIREWYKKTYDKSIDADWRETYENLTRDVGAGSRWFYDDERVPAEVKDYIMRVVLGKGDDYKSQYTADEIARLTDYYVSIYSGKGHKEKIFTVRDRNGNERKLNAMDFIDEKTIFYRGMNFQALLKRSPYDFMINMIQLEPDIVNTKETVVGGIKKKLTPYEYFFATNLSQFSEADRKAIQEYQKRIRERWGEGNYEHIRRVALLWDRAYNYEGFKKTETGEIDEKKARESIYRRMAIAADRIKLRNAVEMTESDVLEGAETEEEKNEAKFIASLFFGDDSGLVNYFVNLRENFGENKGEEHMFGDYGFFYRLGERWYKYDMIGITPNTNEVKLIPIYDQISKVGENIFARLWGDINAWNGTVNGLTNLDEMLLHAATTGDMKAIYELHEKLKTTTEGVYGEEISFKLNYILATTVSRFFQEHTLARFPFPLNYALGSSLGRDISLSRIHRGPLAITWKEENIRLYAHKLWEMGTISEKGRYSMAMLERALGADAEKYITMQAGPSIFVFIALMLFYSFFSKAFEEEGPQEKKGKK
jgi:hypothetical protein